MKGGSENVEDEKEEERRGWIKKLKGREEAGWNAEGAVVGGESGRGEW